MNSLTSILPSVACAECGAPLSPGSTEGLCPRCLLKMGLASGSASRAGSREVVPPPSLPFDFGSYRMLRLLGRGGMGAVYEAEDTASGRRVALKVLGHSLDSPDTRKRFLREGRLAAAINHPNSVYVYGTEEVDGTPVITMELVPGGTLQDRVKSGGPMPVGEAVDAVTQVIAGLEAAHTAGILHRDIKPSNCFLEPGGTVKIGDFGLSISTLARGDSALTVAGSILGTPDFSSPEQLRGEALDVRADIYSVGVTLYYLLTGRAPFQAENMVALLATVLDKPAPSPRTLRPEIPESLAGIILRCLAKPAGDRFRSYDELRHALLPFGTTAPTPATLGRRFVAGFIDSIVFAVVNLTLSLLLMGDLESLNDLEEYHSAKRIWGAAGVFLLQIAYFAVPEGRRGASLGKAIMGLRVGGLDRNAPGIPRAALRAIIYMFPTLLTLLRFRAEAQTMEVNVWNIGISIAHFLYPALLVVTARRRNGFATITDLLTKTRVIEQSAYQAREAVAAPDEAIPATETQPQIGPYHVLAPLGGDLLLGYDARLMRRVWIREVSAGSPPVAAELRGAARPGRLRWLQGRRDGSAGWDAYEAVSGTPLTALLATPQPWKAVRHWLHDLAVELDAATRDGSLPASLSPGRVWITADGRAKLLDFPAPGAAPAPEFAPDIFLNHVAISALEGRVATEDEARASEPRVPVPIRARGVLHVLRGAAFAPLVSQFKALLQHVPEITRRRRIGVVAGFVVPAVVCTGFMLFGTRMYEAWQRTSPEVLPLRNALTVHYTMPYTSARPGVDKEEVRESLELYIASRFGDFIRDPKKWSSPMATGGILSPMRKEAERIVVKYPHPTEEEMKAARAVLGRRLVESGIESGPAPVAPANTARQQVMSPSMVAMTGLGAFIWGAFFSLVATLFRGGLLLRGFGIAVVTRDGSDASRLRMFWRACVAWSWLPLALLSWAMLSRVMSGNTAAWLVANLALAGAVWSIVCRRSLQDRLAGTWLVPR